jgi:hypothetical protein
MTSKMSNHEREKMNGRSSEQLRHPEVRRFLNSMPLFKTDERRSARFDDLLARLEVSEAPDRGH